MKQSLFLVTLVLFISCSSKNGTQTRSKMRADREDPSYSFTAELNGERMTKKDTTGFFQVKTVLRNKGTDTLMFLASACAWWKFYEVDSKDLNIYANLQCCRDWSILVKLAPDTSMDQVITFKTLKDLSELPEVLKFRVGFHMVKVSNENEYYELSSSKYKVFKTMKNVIWSDTLSYGYVK